jgi:hypothetical protein
MNDDVAELGFAFLPFENSNALGYAGVDIVLVEHDDAAGFAPAKLIFPGVNALGDVSAMEVSVRASEEPLLRVAPGFFFVQSHDGDKLAIYCFGGELACHNGGRLMTCHLSSAAPIFNLSEEGFDSDENAVLSVVDNLEGEFAEQRARYTDAEEVIFAQRLANTDPRFLYAVGMALAHRSFKAVPEVMRTEHYWDEYSELNRALQEAETADWWPPVPTLDAVLSSPSTINPPGEPL